MSDKQEFQQLCLDWKAAVLDVLQKEDKKVVGKLSTGARKILYGLLDELSSSYVASFFAEKIDDHVDGINAKLGAFQKHLYNEKKYPHLYRRLNG